MSDLMSPPFCKPLKNLIVAIPARQKKTVTTFLLGYFFVPTKTSNQKNGQKRIAPHVFGSPRPPLSQHHFLIKSNIAEYPLFVQNDCISPGDTVPDRYQFNIILRSLPFISIGSLHDKNIPIDNQ